MVCAATEMEKASKIATPENNLKTNDIWKRLLKTEGKEKSISGAAGTAKGMRLGKRGDGRVLVFENFEEAEDADELESLHSHLRRV